MSTDPAQSSAPDPTGGGGTDSNPGGGAGGDAGGELGYQFYRGDGSLYRAMALADGSFQTAHIAQQDGWRSAHQHLFTLYASPIDTGEAEGMLPEGVNLDDELLPDDSSTEGGVEEEDPTLSEAARAELGPKPKLRKAMSTTDIRDAGVRIDVPYEAPPGNSAPLTYSNGKTLEEMYPDLLDVHGHHKSGDGSGADS